MMQGIADEDGYIIVSFANDHMADFVINWVEHLEALGISAYTVGAMDGKLLARLLQQGVHTFAMQSKLSVKDLQWGSDNFHLMVRCAAHTVHPCCALPCSLPRIPKCIQRIVHATRDKKLSLFYVRSKKETM